MHRLGGSLGVLANNVFEHHNVAGLSHRIIRFRGHDQSECLQISSDIDLAALVVAHQDLAEIDGPAFRRDCPENVGQILIAERSRPFQIGKFHFDFDVAFLALHFGLAARLGHEIGAGKIQLGGSAAMLVVHRLNASADYGDAEGRRVLHGLDDHGGLRVSLSKRAQTQGESGSQQKFSLQSILLKRQVSAMFPPTSVELRVASRH